MPLKIQDTELNRNFEIALERLESSKKQGKVGWFEGENYTLEGGGSIPVAMVAAIQEFGDPRHNIPSRLGMRETANKQNKNWEKLAFNIAKQIADGKQTPESLLEIVSLKAAGDLKEHITTVQEPPLKPTTIEARLKKRKDKKTVGNLTKPLIDSGILLNTLTSKVE